MKDIVFTDRYILSFTKPVWHTDHLTLATRLQFTLEGLTVHVDLRTCARKALLVFFNRCFQEMMEDDFYSQYRVELFAQIKERYDELRSSFYATSICKASYADKMRPYQIDALSEMAHKKYNLLALDMGLGKEQPLDAHVITPSGTKKMGDIKFGDKVISSSGKQCNVIGVYPQGLKDVYEVTFTDGSKARCGLEHLWIYYIPQRKHKGMFVGPIKDIKDDLNRYGRPQYAIPKTKPVEFISNNILPLDPYLMGLMLGDGCFRTTISYSTNDHDELIPVIQSLLPYGMVIKKQKGDNFSWNICPKNTSDRYNKNEMIKILKELNLFNCHSHTKFIPDIYKYTSVDNRIALLQGMLDSDGHFSKEKARLSVTTVSNKLAKDIQWIVQSLGGTASIGTSVRDGKRDCLFMSILLPNEITPFRLTRRLAIYRPKQREHHRKIISVELVGKEECQCIAVDSEDHSYLTNEFIVTHNTITSTTMSRALEVRRTIIVCPASVKWSIFRDMTDNWGYNPLFFTILDSEKRRRIQAFQERFVIINYDILEKFMPYLTSMPVGHIILDEAHRCKDISTTRFKNVQKLLNALPAAKVTMMSGTPIRNRVNDIFALLKLAKHPLGDNHAAFLREFANVRAGMRGRKDTVTGGKNLDRLFDVLSNFMIRRTKEECLKDLPEKIIQKYYIQDEEYKEEYNKVIEEMINGDHGTASVNSSLHSANRIVAMAKLRATPGIFDLIDEIIDQERKVVVFSFYKNVIDMIVDKYGEAAVKIDGTVNTTKRDQAITRFKEDPKCMVFVGQTDAAGEGIDLTIASDVIFCDFPFTSTQLDQALSRCHRSRQKNCVNVYYCMIQDEDSIDHHLFDMIADKAQDINAAINRDKPGLVDYKDIKEELFNKLIGKRKQRHEV